MKKGAIAQLAAPNRLSDLDAKVLRGNFCTEHPDARNGSSVYSSSPSHPFVLDMTNFVCDSCGFSKQVPDKFAGKRVACPKCKKATTIAIALSSQTTVPALISSAEKKKGNLSVPVLVGVVLSTVLLTCLLLFASGLLGSKEQSGDLQHGVKAELVPAEPEFAALQTTTTRNQKQSLLSLGQPKEPVAPKIDEELERQRILYEAALAAAEAEGDLAGQIKYLRLIENPKIDAAVAALPQGDLTDAEFEVTKKELTENLRAILRQKVRKILGYSN